MLSMSKLRDVAEGVWEPDGEATGLSLSGSAVILNGLIAASFSLPVTASDAALRPSIFRALIEDFHPGAVPVVGEVFPLTGFGEDSVGKLSFSRFVTVGDGGAGDLIGVRFLALEERNLPL